MHDDSINCPCCGQTKSREIDYGDFSRAEVQAWVGEYAMSVMRGYTGWGMPFTVWVELTGKAKHDKLFRLVKIQDPSDDVHLPT